MPAASNQKCSAANSGVVDQRLDKAVAAGRAKSSTWKVNKSVNVPRYDGITGLWLLLSLAAKKQL